MAVAQSTVITAHVAYVVGAMVGERDASSEAPVVPTDLRDR
jgi:hypothetical protein